jgi:hypothetical protein
MVGMGKIEGQDKISHPSILGLWPGILILPEYYFEGMV